MAKRCPPGAICIENCTFLFLIIALCLMYMLYTKNSKSSQNSGVSSERIHIYTNQPVDTPMMDRFPAAMFENKDVFSDPYAPPLRDTRVFPKNSSDPRGIPINIQTQGHDSPYRQVGMLSRKDGSETMLPLMGRPLLTNRDKWQFYTMSDSNNSIKLPISQNGRSCTNEYGCDNLYNGDNVYIEGYNDAFEVTLYDNDRPNYIPYL